MPTVPIAGLCVLSDWYNPEADRTEIAYWVVLEYVAYPRRYRAMRLLPGAGQGPIDVITLDTEQVFGASPWQPRRDYYAASEGSAHATASRTYQEAPECPDMQSLW